MCHNQPACPLMQGVAKQNKTIENHQWLHVTLQAYSFDVEAVKNLQICCMDSGRSCLNFQAYCPLVSQEELVGTGEAQFQWEPTKKTYLTASPEIISYINKEV